MSASLYSCFALVSTPLVCLSMQGLHAQQTCLIAVHESHIVLSLAQVQNRLIHWDAMIRERIGALYPERHGRMPKPQLIFKKH